MIEDYRDFILNEYGSRQFRNKAYSMRAFARDIGLKQSTLSRILNHQIGLSVGAAKSLVKKLSLTEIEEEIFLALVESKHSRVLLQKRNAKKRLKNLLNSIRFKKINEDAFAIIQDWYCLAIYSLIIVEDFQPNAKWIASRLKISNEQASSAILKMFETKMIYEKNDKWFQGRGFPIIYSPVPAKSIRNYHRQILHKAEAALESVPVDHREFGTYNLAIDPAQYQEFAEIIKKSMMSAVSQIKLRTKKRHKVYAIHFNFFPLDCVQE